MTVVAEKAVRVVLLDIEGTVCPISFVKNVLYPFSLQALPTTLATQWDNPFFVPYRDSFPAEHRSSPAAMTAHFQDLLASDIKASYLKSLQGYLWKEGYETGLIKAPLYADVLPALRAWNASGISVMIYSSGSVPAQKLLFQHCQTIGESAPGLGLDVTPFICDYFDTVNAGPKTAANSYAKILATKAERYPTASSWLFLSDNVLEVEAAREAGLQSIVVQRPGNPTHTEDVTQKHRVITTFEGLL